MEMSRKKKTTIRIILAAVLSVVLCCGFVCAAGYGLTEYINYRFPSRAHHIYDLDWLEGKTQEQIVKKYGDFTKFDAKKDMAVYRANLYDTFGDCTGVCEVKLYFDNQNVCIKTDVRYIS